MNLRGARGNEIFAIAASVLHPGIQNIDNGSVGDGHVHGTSRTRFIFVESTAAVRATRAFALIKIQFDLRSRFLTPKLRDYIPFESINGFEINGFHTSSNPDFGGYASLYRHAHLTESPIFCLDSLG